MVLANLSEGELVEVLPFLLEDHYVLTDYMKHRSRKIMD